MNSRCVLCLVVVASAGLAQKQEMQEPRFGDEQHVRRVMKYHGIGGQGAKYQAMGQTEIESLTPLLAWLESQFGPRETRKSSNAPLRSFDEPLQIIVREDAQSKVFNVIWVHVRLKDTFDEAGTAAAIYLSRLPLLAGKGSFSGVTVGDWTANGEYGGDPALFFTRKNAFVRVLCNQAIEILKSDNIKRGVADPGIKDKCEALARDIDAQIDRLPGRKM